MSHKKKHTTKERFAILENVSAQMFVAIEKLSLRLDAIDEFLTKATKDFKEDGMLSLKCKSGRGRKLLLNTDKHKDIIEKNITNYPHQPKTAFALTVEETGVKMSYDTFKLFLKKHCI